MFSRMLIRRTVAAKRGAALLAGPEVHPRTTDFHTLLASSARW